MKNTAPEQFLLPVRMLNEYAYCPRLFYYEFSAGEFTESSDTIEGSFTHRNVDNPAGILPGSGEMKTDSEDVEISARSVLLSSTKYGIISRIDLVEGNSEQVWPVEYKKGESPGKGQAWLPDSVQICAQTLILRENGYNCDECYIYYQGSHERVKVEMTEEIIGTTVRMIKLARELSESGVIPAPLKDSRKCERCSIAAICLPDETLFLKSEISIKDNSEVRKMYPARDDALPLYVQEQGASISKRNEELEVRLEGKVISRVKLLNVSSVSLLGNIQITTQTVHELLRRNIPVAYFSVGGWFDGITNGMLHKNVELRIKQYEKAMNNAISINVARTFIYGKIKNSRTLLRRNTKVENRSALNRLSDLSKMALISKNKEQLLGIEGSAARVYFQHFKDMMSAQRPSLVFDFSSRNRRPPKDPINALLSFNYALLAKETSIALMKVGFDPYLGFLHSHRYGNPALALDLMEEFRPIIVDSTVINLVNTGEIGDSDFILRGSAAALNSKGRKKAIRAYERRMDTLITHPIFGYSVSYRRIIEVQARLLSRWVSGEIKEYPVFLVR